MNPDQSVASGLAVIQAQVLNCHRGAHKMLQAYDLWMFPRTFGLLVPFAALPAGLMRHARQAQAVTKTAELFNQEENISVAILQRILPA